MVRILALSLALIMAGCHPISTDPGLAFMDVQENVCDRSGEHVEWTSRYYHSCEVKDLINSMLDDSLTLDQVLYIVLLNNPKLQAIYEEIGISQAQLVQASLLKNPVLSLSLRFSSGFDYIIESGLLQDFLDILLKPAKRKLARAELEITKLKVTGEILQIIAQTEIAFHSLRKEIEILSLQREITDAYDASGKFAKRLHQAGNVTDLFLSIEESKSKQAQIDQIAQELHVIKETERLNVLMGLEQGACLTLSDDHFIFQDTLESEDALQLKAIAASIDLQILQLKMRSLALEAGITINETVFQKFELGPDVERKESGVWYLGPQLGIGIPLFDFGYAKSAEFKAKLKQLCHKSSAHAVKLCSEVRLAHFYLINSQEKFHIAQELIPLAEKTTEETLRQTNAMQVGVFELLQTKQRELVAKQQAVHSMKEILIAKTNLELLLRGKMWENND